MKASIVITSYNYDQYLSDAIESVLSQSFRDFELIIVDDASTDNSPEIIRDYAQRDERIKFIQHSTNQGLYSTLMDGVEMAQGEYLHGLSADDKYLPGFLEKTIRYLEKHPELGICFSDFGYFYESDKILTNKLIDKVNLSQSFSPKSLIPVLSKNFFWIPGHTTIIRTKLFRKYGGYNPRLHSLMDWYLIHSVALFEGAGYIPETLSAMRIHEQNYSQKCKHNKILKQEIHQTLFNLLEDPNNAELKNRYKRSALLGFLFKDPQALLHPKLWSFYPPLIQKSLRNRLKRMIAF